MILIFVPPPTIVGREHCVFGSSNGSSVVRLSIFCRSVSTHFMGCDISLLSWMISVKHATQVDIAEKVFKVGDQRSRSWTYNDGVIHFDGTALRHACFNLLFYCCIDYNISLCLVCNTCNNADDYHHLLPHHHHHHRCRRRRRRHHHQSLPRCRHCMQRRLSTRKLSACPSVCLSVKRVICDKTKGTSAHILIPHERSFILVLWQEEWLVGSSWPRWSESTNFQSIFARSASAVTPSKKFN